MICSESENSLRKGGERGDDLVVVTVVSVTLLAESPL